MDAFLLSFKELCLTLLPILGAFVLAFLIRLLYGLIKVVDKANITVEKGNHTIDLVDVSLQKVQAPLETVEKISETVDKAHDATIQACKDAKEFVAKNIDGVKEKVISIVEKNNTEDELKEPSPEDLIKGE